MIKVKITKNELAIELDFDEAEEMETGLVAISRMMLNLSPPPPPNASCHVPDQTIAKPQFVQAEISMATKLSAETLKEQRVERMKRARRLNNAGGPSQTICLVKALKELGVPSTAEEIYHYMVNTPHIDFTTSAADPLHGIKQALRSKTRLFTDFGNKVYTLASEAEQLAISKGNLSHKA